MSESPYRSRLKLGKYRNFSMLTLLLSPLHDPKSKHISPLKNRVQLQLCMLYSSHSYPYVGVLKSTFNSFPLRKVWGLHHYHISLFPELPYSVCKVFNIVSSERSPFKALLRSG